MNDLHPPCDAARQATARPARIPVWDLPLRLFHWLLALCFAGAYLTAEAEGWRTVHVTLGYTMAGLVAFRIAWGLAGTAHARFASFVRGPRATVDYLRSLLEGHPRHFTGHNPAGALAVLAMLGLSLAIAASGWLLLGSRADILEDVHEALANVMLGLVGLHVAGVLVSSVLHRENLVGAMISGRKLAAPADRPQPQRRMVALALLCAVLAFWGWQAAHPDAPLGVDPASARQR